MSAVEQLDYNPRPDEQQQLEEEQQQEEFEEEEEEPLLLDENEVRKPMPPNDERRMLLTPQEQERALVIKDIVELTPELDNLSDFQYAQLAIYYLRHQDATLSEDDFVASVVERVRNLQEIRHEYSIRETFPAARQVIHKALELYGDHFLGFSFSADTDNYVMIVDQSGIPTLKVLRQQTEGTKLRLQEMYYVNHIMNPDFQSIRNGYIILSECGNVSSREQCISLHLLQEMLHMTDVYPNKLIQNKNFHTGLFSNLLLSMAKRVMPKLTSAIEVGCTLDSCDGANPTTLNQIYNIPNKQVARKRLLFRLEETLKRKYQNEAEFTLECHSDPLDRL